MRSRYLLITLSVAILFLGVGCRHAKPSTATTSVNAPVIPARVIATGVRGVVLIGPSCPVARIPVDPQCAPHPLGIDLVVTEDGKEVARGQSGDDGRFSFALPPGKYRIAQPKNAPALPRVPVREFTVTADGFTNLTVEADSGIR